MAKRLVESNQPTPNPVKHIKPPKKSYPADLCTIATILLRKNADLFKVSRTADQRYCYALLCETARRQIGPDEARKVIALITQFKDSV